MVDWNLDGEMPASCSFSHSSSWPDWYFFSSSSVWLSSSPKLICQAIPCHSMSCVWNQFVIGSWIDEKRANSVNEKEDLFRCCVQCRFLSQWTDVSDEIRLQVETTSLSVIDVLRADLSLCVAHRQRCSRKHAIEHGHGSVFTSINTVDVLIKQQPYHGKGRVQNCFLYQHYF